jgi:hypothetical protein
MNHNAPSTTEDLEHAILGWEESVKRIRKGWDCFEEYTHDLSYRKDIDDTLTRYSLYDSVPETLLRRIAAADGSFLKATVASRLCVWHCEPGFQYYPDGQVELSFASYDQETYWYYYHWQPDCPYSWQEHDGISYQRDVYGLDFNNMSVSELKEAARQYVVHWNTLKSRLCNEIE